MKRSAAIAILKLALALGASATAAGAQEAGARPAKDKDADEPDLVVLDAFTVSSERDYGYRASNSISATRTNTPIKDIPVNIQVFTKDFSDDLLIKSQVGLETYNAALVDGGQDRHSDNTITLSFGQFLFRGFQQDWELRDGIREYDPVDTQNIARVEVVKGPAAALHGMTYPGGIIQSITKTVELDRDFTALRFTVGNEGDYRATLDANHGGTTGRSKFGVRVNGVYEKSQDERAHSAGQTQLETAALLWQPTPSTQAELLIEHGQREKPNSMGYFSRPEYPDASGLMSLNHALIPLQIVHPEIPWTWNWSNGKNRRSLTTRLYRGTLTQKIGENFQLRGYWQYAHRDQIEADGWGSYGDPGPVTMRQGFGSNTGWVTNPTTGLETIQSAYHYQDWANGMHSYGVTAVYRMDFKEAKNTFAFGAYGWAENFSSPGAFEMIPTYVSYPVQANIPTGAPAAPPAVLKSVLPARQHNSNDIIYANWQGSWLHDRLKTNLSISRTNLSLIDLPADWLAETRVFKQSKTSPLFGAIFEITKELSVFALHATSLFPDETVDSHFNHFSPKVGSSLEGGFKFETANGKISGTTSYYRISQQGGAQWDPAKLNASGTPGDVVQGGEQESKGYEADIVFQPTRSWQVVVSYAHNDQHITRSAQPYTIGQSAPEHITRRYALVSKYTFAEGHAKGVYLGIGLNGGSKASKDFIEWPAGSGRFVARYEPGRISAELFGGRRLKLFDRDVLVQVNIKNLTRTPDYAGWQRTGSPAILATERYRVPTSVVYRLTIGLDW